MRAFFAVDLPQDIKDKLSSFISSLLALPARIKWTRPPHLHITLKFIPRLKAEHIITLEKKLGTILRPLPAFSLQACRLCLLSRKKEARLIYLKLEESRSLLRIKEEIEHEAETLGYPPEERKPLFHITLGRVKECSQKEKLASALERRALAPLLWQAEYISLYQSQLKPDGPLYRKLFTIKLSGRKPD